MSAFAAFFATFVLRFVLGLTSRALPLRELRTKGWQAVDDGVPWHEFGTKQRESSRGTGSMHTDPGTRRWAANVVHFDLGNGGVFATLATL